MLRKIGERKNIKKFEKIFKLKIDFCQWITKVLFSYLSRAKTKISRKTLVSKLKKKKVKKNFTQTNIFSNTFKECSI